MARGKLSSSASSRQDPEDRVKTAPTSRNASAVSHVSQRPQAQTSNDPDAMIPGVPPPPTPYHRPAPLESRPTKPFVVASDEGLYLEEHVWPTLNLALEKLLSAIPYNIPKVCTRSDSRPHPSLSNPPLQEIRQQYQDPSMRRIKHPEHAQFAPIEWLARFLKEHNPNKPPQLSTEQAAIVLQSYVRRKLARDHVARLRSHAAQQRAEREQAELRDAAARRIQAAYRGHSVRLALKAGKLQDIRGW
ncbi:uncharacterized protein MONBRDRAFT_11052 [Monosiga brevicollis MX1]|uniref:Uncharacterized protein n=1 Tax=Monosiga brevicollis TaxID=81824 RepID=A9V826_MONBE|nr:uncharacterized protein MONBRDRAFT_11052 [Monosiga brevicollis MX1]EDQ86266.1 predicted protein [Monosiga brevicollis MX1]|eukprot:XP_001748936.1 hypothetical protein [Monosiga brevicollis MX1]